MKVLYIGNYNDGTGWGNACLNNILALDSAGVNIVPRAITFKGLHNTNNQRIAELEDQSEQDGNSFPEEWCRHPYQASSAMSTHRRLPRYRRLRKRRGV